MGRDRFGLAQPDDDDTVGLRAVRGDDVESGHGLASEFCDLGGAGIDASRIGFRGAGRQIRLDRLQQDGDTSRDTMGFGKGNVDLADHGDSIEHKRI